VAGAALGASVAARRLPVDGSVRVDADPAMSSFERRWVVARPLVVAALRETGVVMLLYSLWQYAGAFSLVGVEDALDRARWVVRFQDAIGLPSEIALQKLVLPFPWLVRSANAYYAIFHVPALVATLIWGFFSHRQHYSRLRNALVLTTAACLGVQLIPLAPPRMLEDLGYVDTAMLYNESVYGVMGRGMAGQLAAMPSVHVAWAIIVGWFAWKVTCRRWAKVLGVGHAVLTVLVVSATANHFWLDGIVAALLLVVSLGVISLTTAIRSRFSSSVPITTK
jgi:PAP2 superfamily